MNHRERLLCALDHKATDRVPLDLGSTFATSINLRAYGELRRQLGLRPESQPRVLSLRAATVIPGEDVLSRFAVDARALLLGSPDGRPDRQLRPDAYLDEWGVTWSKPAGGHYINVNGPFQHLQEPRLGHLDGFPWPDPDDPRRYRGLRERARALHEGTDYAVVLNLDLGPVHLAQFTRGFTEWLEDLLLRPAFAEALVERIVNVWVRIADRALAEAARFVDVVAFYDDLGSQKAPLMRPQLYRSLIKPHHQRMTAAVQRYRKKMVWHSCGSVYQFIPDLIDLGIDALNPVQVSAANMDPPRLKREFGRHLAFWGAVDTGSVLPWGSVADVRAEVRRRIDQLGEGGGYVLSAVHNIQADVPPENVVAMYDAAREISIAASAN